jgi:hypothetical protein
MRFGTLSLIESIRIVQSVASSSQCRLAFGHERAAALMAMQQPLLAQDVHGFPDGDARHLELALELDERRDLLARPPLPPLDALAHDRRNLDVQGNPAAVVGLQELGHGSVRRAVGRRRICSACIIG